MATETKIAEAPFDAMRVARFLRSPEGSLRVALVNVATDAEFGSLPLANASREELARVMGVVKLMQSRLAGAPVVLPAAPPAAPPASETPAERYRRLHGKSVWFRFGPRRVTVVLNGPRGDRSDLAARKYETADAMKAITPIATGHGGVILPPRAITRNTEDVEIFITSLPPDAVQSFVRSVTNRLGMMGFQAFEEPNEAPPAMVPAPVPAPITVAPPREARAVPFAQRFGASAPEPVRPRVVFTRSRFGAGSPEPLRPLPPPPPPTEAQKAASAPIGAILETPAQAQQSPDPDVASGGRKWSTHQRAVFEHIRAATNHLVIRAVAGSGKCLGKGTPVMLADGRVVPVES